MASRGMSGSRGFEGSRTITRAQAPAGARGALGDALGVSEEHVRHPAAHGAAADKCNPQRIAHGADSVMYRTIIAHAPPADGYEELLEPKRRHFTTKTQSSHKGTQRRPGEKTVFTTQSAENTETRQKAERTEHTISVFSRCWFFSRCSPRSVVNILDLLCVPLRPFPARGDPLVVKSSYPALVVMPGRA